MDFLIEILIETLGAVIELFFGELSVKKLPRFLRFVIILVFWIGLAALFFWLSALAFKEIRAISILLELLSVASAVIGVMSLVHTMKRK